MFCQPRESPYDWNFSLFGTRVCVQPFFWLAMAVIGWRFADSGVGYLLAFVAVAFASLLLHEFGHVWAGAVFGARYSSIVLYGFGGLAVGASDVPRWWQRVIVYLAGPGVQLAVAGVLYAYFHPPLAMPAFVVLLIAYLVNWWWGLFNLLPIWPFDGGRVMMEFAKLISPAHGQRAAHLISAVGAALFVLNFVAQMQGHDLIPWLPPVGLLGVMFFGINAYENYQIWHAMRPTWQRLDRDDVSWER